MTNHTDLINLIIKKLGLKSYIEIGVFNPDHNFNKIEVQRKVGVDPDPAAKADICKTSDEFFKIMQATDGRADLFFIDGLHHADQVKKDIINAWNRLYHGGVIVVHDCNPPTEATTCVPRGNQREWCGNVFQAISNLYTRPKFTVNFDYGCCVIRKQEDSALTWNDKVYDWETFNENRKELLNLIDPQYVEEALNGWRQ